MRNALLIDEDLSPRRTGYIPQTDTYSCRHHRCVEVLLILLYRGCPGDAFHTSADVFWSSSQHKQFSTRGHLSLFDFYYYYLGMVGETEKPWCPGCKPLDTAVLLSFVVDFSILRLNVLVQPSPKLYYKINSPTPSMSDSCCEWTRCKAE